MNKSNKVLSELGIDWPPIDGLYTFAVPRPQENYQEWMIRDVLPMIDELETAGVNYYHFFTHSPNLDIRISIDDDQKQQVETILSTHNLGSLKPISYLEEQYGGIIGSQILLRWYHNQSVRIVEILRAISWFRASEMDDPEICSESGLISAVSYMHHMLHNAWGEGYPQEIAQALKTIHGDCQILSERFPDLWLSMRDQVLHEIERLKVFITELPN